ncbi:MAG: polysaccharide biosynthesis/export family protein [Bacteroidales bacterium]|uniref:polysaccharide biosynthesis/export family protein n=1 Tax=Candidatus Cryptobacteroides sp. TaxID=2952915 RepID=UPI002A7EE023|nr:polysaccharide biosynthesis/export family protein [Candidatus Cryptobacteroides sp.]MDD7136027.1 polysaccharide biosynthesis/export family protein [Bacteroidales bacterium]MDY3877811.1 polysaccharide biosynthesis/export family protein [Candidatus Cryptobacteroides sp.]MDY5316935.1 polysaccharide biosynthesis/export family protein [Candidatus Cryptobacteroides sp.]
MKKQWILAVAALLSLASCGSYKKLTYLQDMEVLTTYDVKEQPNVLIGVNDKLRIVVTCQEPTLAAPFNLSTGVFSVNPETGESVTKLSSEAESGYVVDKNGYIDFPVIGLVKAEGLTLEGLREDLIDKIIETKYIKDPIVLVEFMNFQFTVLGEANPGNYNVPNGHINLLEALALAGDLKPSAKRDDVWVIRTENGQRMVYSVDMRSKDLFESPAFNIQQNDIIYVKPLKSVKDADATKRSSVITTVISALSTVSSITLAFVYAGVIGSR